MGNKITPYQKRKPDNEITERTARKRAKHVTDLLDEIVEPGNIMGKHIVTDLIKNHKEVAAPIISQEMQKDSVMTKI